MVYVIIAVVLVVVALAAGGLLLAPRRRRALRKAPETPPVEAGRPGQGAVAAPEAEAAAPAVAGEAVQAPPPQAVAEPQAPPLAGRMARLRGRLARSQMAFGPVLLNLLSRDGLDEEGWQEVEDTLVAADLGVGPARQVVDELRTQVRVGGVRGTDAVRALLKEDLLEQLGTDLDRSLHLAKDGARPAVVLMVGVNGTGKTSACGKLARALVGEGWSVLLGAADTFRAAAADQLQTWGTRVGARVVRSDKEGADPASVAFEAVKQGIDARVDAVIIDTAGRLHTKTGLMDELGKIKRVVERQAAVDEVLLVLDATTGQNGLRQATVFAEAVNVTGVVLTKLDGTAKGGIVVAVQRELGVPVKLVGLGEGPDDLAPFDPVTFVEAILG
ncbi:MAG TPA: signal recognition particle-docking protein FtsY [Streptosporangiaceae bacterium]|nr:signal recognition particle-docking protein FtsY [Streptosporangiaceae bacterium]